MTSKSTYASAAAYSSGFESFGDAGDESESSDLEDNNIDNTLDRLTQSQQLYTQTQQYQRIQVPSNSFGTNCGQNPIRNYSNQQPRTSLNQIQQIQQQQSQTQSQTNSNSLSMSMPNVYHHLGIPGTNNNITSTENDINNQILIQNQNRSPDNFQIQNQISNLQNNNGNQQHQNLQGLNLLYQLMLANSNSNQNQNLNNFQLLQLQQHFNLLYQQQQNQNGNLDQNQSQSDQNLNNDVTNCNGVTNTLPGSVFYQSTHSPLTLGYHGIGGTPSSSNQSQFNHNSNSMNHLNHNGNLLGKNNLNQNKGRTTPISERSSHTTIVTASPNDLVSNSNSMTVNTVQSLQTNSNSNDIDLQNNNIQDQDQDNELTNTVQVNQNLDQFAILNQKFLNLNGLTLSGNLNGGRPGSDNDLNQNIDPLSKSSSRSYQAHGPGPDPSQSQSVYNIQIDEPGPSPVGPTGGQSITQQTKTVTQQTDLNNKTDSVTTQQIESSQQVQRKSESLVGGPGVGPGPSGLQRKISGGSQRSLNKVNNQSNLNILQPNDSQNHINDNGAAVDDSLLIGEPTQSEHDTLHKDYFGTLATQSSTTNQNQNRDSNTQLGNLNRLETLSQYSSTSRSQNQNLNVNNLTSKSDSNCQKQLLQVQMLRHGGASTSNQIHRPSNMHIGGPGIDQSTVMNSEVTGAAWQNFQNLNSLSHQMNPNRHMNSNNIINDNSIQAGRSFSYNQQKLAVQNQQQHSTYYDLNHNDNDNQCTNHSNNCTIESQSTNSYKTVQQILTDNQNNANKTVNQQVIANLVPEYREIKDEPQNGPGGPGPGFGVGPQCHSQSQSRNRHSNSNTNGANTNSNGNGTTNNSSSLALQNPNNGAQSMSGIFYFEVDSEIRITYWSRCNFRVTGYSAAEVHQTHLYLYLNQEVRPQLRRLFLDALDQGVESSNFQLPINTKDGKIIYILLSISPKYNEQNGQIEGVICIGQDITKMKNTQAESELRLLELAALVDGTNAPIIAVDTNLKITLWNKFTEQLTGYKVSDTIGKNFIDSFIEPDVRQSVRQVLLKALEGYETSNYQFPLYTKYRKRLHILLNATPKWDTTNGNRIVGVVGLGQDITELKSAQAESELRAADLTALVDGANAPIIAVDRNLKITLWNKFTEELTGFPRRETIDQKLVDAFIEPEARSAVRQVLFDALEGKETSNYQFPLYTKYRRKIDILLNATSRRDSSNQIVGVVGVGQDITEMKSAQNDMDARVMEMTALVEGANAPIIAVDQSLKITLWNRCTERLTGFSVEDTLGKEIVESFIEPEARKDVRKVLHNALEGKETSNYQFRLYTKDRRKLEILLNATPKRDPSNRIVGVVGVGQDITDMKFAQAESDARALEMTALIEGANAPIIAVDRQLNITLWNHCTERLTGFYASETMGKEITETFIEPETRYDVRHVLLNALAGNGTSNYQFVLFTKDRRKLEILLNATPKRDAHNQIVGVVGVGQDITELKKAQAESETKALEMTTLVQGANAPIIAVDTSLQVRLWNKCTERLTGYAIQETLGKDLVETFIEPEVRESVRQV